MQGTITDEMLTNLEAKEAHISAIYEILAENVGPQKFRIWFKNSTKLTLAGEYLKVGVPNLFIARWIENHFLKEISLAVKKVTGTEPKINFTIDPELSGSQRRTQSNSKVTAAATSKIQNTSQTINEE